MEPEGTLAGRTLLHYRVLAKIGEGGMGVVYHARDIRLDRDVVLKVLAPGRSSPQDQRRFLGEAKAASALNHPNIVTIYEIASADNLEFIAMERVEGATLQQLIGERGLSLRDTLDYAVQIAGALARAHAAGIVHRDIKPGNIMVTPQGLVKVLDFGLAKRTLSQGEDDSTIENQSFETLTQAGLIVGTPSYMSPEQISGDRVDFRSDIFAFGVVLYEMLTGLRPFKGGSAIGVARSILDVQPPAPSTVRSGLPDEVDAVLARCLAKKPGGRYASTADLASELKTIQTQLTYASGDRVATVSMARGLRRFSRRRSARFWLVAALALVLAMGAIVLAVPGLRSRFTRMAAVAAGTPLSLNRQGRAYLERYDQPGNVDRAIDVFTRSIKLDTQDPAAYAGLADAYVAKNNLTPDDQWLKLAKDSAAQALKLQPDLAAAHLSMGSALFRSGSNQAAADEFQRAQELDPLNAEVYLHLGAAQRQRGQWQEAEASYRKAISLRASNWRQYSSLGELLYTRGRYAEAVVAYEKARDLSGDNALVFRSLGAAYHALNRDDEAASAFQRALEIQPSPLLYSNLGTLEFFRGHYSAAATDFEKALALDATSYLLWGNLGDAYRWSPGTQDKAQDAYGRAIQLARAQLQRQPADANARGRLALYLVKSGDTKTALAELRPLELQAGPTLPTFYRAAVVYELAGQRENALASLQKALERGYAISEIENEPEFVNLRRDARYQRLLLKFSARGR